MDGARSYCTSPLECAKTIPAGVWDIVFVGTGSSSATPNIWCTVNKDNMSEPCVCCHQIPFNPMNKRGNPSIVLRRTPIVPIPTLPSIHAAEETPKEVAKTVTDGEPAKDGAPTQNFVPSVKKRTEIEPKPYGYYNVLVDLGKTFRDAALLHFYKNNISSINSVLLTHEHADAILGLDDLRDVQVPKSKTGLDLYASEGTMNCVRGMFPYLFPKPNAPKTGLFTAALTGIVIHHFVPFYLEDLEIIPIPLYHGGCVCNGFIFSHYDSDSQFVYFSDFRCRATTPYDKETLAVPILTQADFDALTFLVDPEKTLALLKRKPISTLVMDTLHRILPHISHSSLPETVALIKSLVNLHQVKPRKVFLVGMSCDMDYDDVKRSLAKDFPDPELTVEPAFDGMVLSL